MHTTLHTGRSADAGPDEVSEDVGPDALEGATARAIAESSPDTILVLSVDARIRYINRTVPDLTVEGVLGQPIYDYVPAEYEDAVRACFARVRATRRPDAYETAYRSKDGDVTWWKAHVTPIERGDRLEGFCIYCRNVAERRAAAVARDRFFSMSQDLLCITARDGAFQLVNPALARLVGASVASLEGRRLSDLVHEEDRARAEEALTSLKNGTDVRGLELRLVASDGSHRWVLWEAASDPHAGLHHLVGRDITERLQYESRLQRAQTMDALGQLAAGVAHDFQNLVLAMRTKVHAAQRAAGAAARDEHLQDALDVIGRAAALSRKLLTFGRRQPIAPIALDLEALARSLTDLLQSLLPPAVSVRVRCAPDLDRVLADPTQVDQVVLNLCMNARDAMPDGGRIDISARNEPAGPGDGGRRFVRLTVSDEGTGMTPEVRERIFEPFFSTKDRDKGTGLGLSTVYGVVERHGGRIDVESEPGRGTSFHVLLPAAPPASSAPERPVEASPAPTPAPDPAPSKGAVLVVEDQPLVREIVVEILEAAGYDVLSAADGEAAVEVCQGLGSRPLDVVVLDIRLPRVDGPEALRRIRALRPEVGAVFTSGAVAPEDLREIEPRDGDVLMKPYDPATLLERVRLALNPGGS